MDNEEELVDVNANLDETETVESADSDESLNSEGEDNTPAKKNKSNWKKMKQELKATKAELAKYKSSSDDSESDDEDDSDDEDTDEAISFKYAPIELEVKFLKNPLAQEYEAEIMANLKKYPDMDFDDAFKLAKADKPVSETKRNLSLRSTSKPKDISSLSQEEAFKLSDSDYLKWARATGNVKE
mgnify:CR=1 FL=1